MRDIAELIRIYVNFEDYDEAIKLYDYFGQLVRELGDNIKPQYLNRYNSATETITPIYERQKSNAYGKKY